jgi:hypothetical protein
MINEIEKNAERLKAQVHARITLAVYSSAAKAESISYPSTV